jgi:signal transduction histidine kinase
MDADARFIDLHIPDAAHFPWNRDQMIGKTIAEYYGPEPHALQVRYNQAAVRTGEVQIFEYKIPVGETVLTLESRVARSGDNEVVVTVRDVSERNRFEDQLTMLAERERNRIGNEIHDGLAQMLAGVRLLIEHLQKRLTNEGSRYAQDATEAATLINNAIGQARELVRDLSAIPEGTTLLRGLELLASHCATYLGVTCRTKFSGTDGHVSEAAVAHLYRITQEALANAIEHGRADTIEIVCKISPNRLLLTVADNGVGLLEETHDTTGLGIKMMRHRARAIGGEITLTRRTKGGIMMTCRCGAAVFLK